MPKYLVKQKSYVNGAIAEEGDIVDYTPPEGTIVSTNLEPVKGKDLKEHSRNDRDEGVEEKHDKPVEDRKDKEDKKPFAR